MVVALPRAPHVTETVLELRSRTLLRLVLFGAVALLYGALPLAAAAGAAFVFAAVLVVALFVDAYVESRQLWLRGLLRSAQLSLSLRGVIAALSFALLIARSFDGWGDGHAVGVAALVVSLPLSRSLYLMVLTVYRALALRPLETRNLDLGSLVGSPPPPRLLTQRIDRWLILLGGATLVVGATGIAAGREWPFVVLALGYEAAVVGAAGYLVRRTLLLRREPSHALWEERVLTRIRDVDAQVVLYFSGSPSSAYQIDMWLATLESLPFRTVVLLRERSVLQRLAPTTLPVVCMPSGVSVMQAGLGSARVALYAANTSKNLHMLREPGVKHVFIGHGDSDKVSSINPFVRVYDQVWVAGRAARDRWSRAAVGVRDEAVVEVGRPQLDVVTLDPDRPPAPASVASTGAPMTVLYAPTWEGWNDDTFFSSITQMGPRLVAMLLESHPDVRIIYKPHPFTGTRDKQAESAHRQIMARLAKANVAAPGVGAPRQDDAAAPAPRPGEPAQESRRRAAEWAAEWWAARSGSHVVVAAGGPTLYDCFNHADVLVADVSSVVSDFLASAKPYVCANPQGLDEDEFCQENPTASAGYILDPQCHRLSEIIGLVRGADPLATRRGDLREYLLGPDSPPSIQRWQAALHRLMAVDDGPDSRAAGRSAGPVGVDESVLEEMQLDADDRDEATDAPKV